MTDIRIRNGRVYTPAGPVDADLLITGETIEGLVGRDHPTAAAQEIDAGGKIVIPGGVDLHAHARTPGLSYKEDFQTVSQAAAVGGITTFVDMPNVEPPTDTVELFLQKREMAERDSLVDWGHFVSGSRTDQIAAIAAAGATGFKIYMIGGGYPHDDRISVNRHDHLYTAFEEIAKTGLPLMLHPFDQRLFDMFSARAFAADEPPDHVTFSRTYTENDVVWRTAVAVVIELQRETGVRVQVLHTHAAGSIHLIRDAKARGHRITAAIDPKYFHLTPTDLDLLGPKICPAGFVTTSPERMQVIFDALNDGTLDVIDSDHAPHTVDDVEKARIDAWKAHLGSPQYDHQLSVLLNDVNKGQLKVPALVRATAENPARILGLYPKKGALLPGSDADLVIIDLNQEKVLRDEDVYTKCGWTPYHNWRIKGVPVLTMLRGTVIARDGKVVGERGFGRYIPGRPQEFTEPQPGLSPGLSLRPRA